LDTTTKENTGKQKRREEIADAFFDHFCHYGFKKTAVDDVTQELGMSKKTIYQHFDSKEDIFHYVVNRLASGILKEISRELEAVPTCCEKFRLMIDLAFSKKRKALKTKGKIKDRHEREVLSAAFGNAFFDLEKRLIHEGIQKGEFEVDDAESTAKYVHLIIGTGIEDLEEDPDRYPEEEIKKAICKLLK
jgi:AcrR family transcriptional regulator